MPEKSDIFALALSIVENSSGRMAIAHNEDDVSRKKDEECQHFLKLDEKRFCRDLEIYGIMAISIGWEQTLCCLLEELILPIKTLLPESYKAGSEKLIEMGEAVFATELHQDWIGLF